jgi:hypothetical protein
MMSRSVVRTEPGGLQVVPRMAQSRSPRSFRSLQVWLVVLTAGLVFLIALGSGRSFARISPARRLLDLRPAVGDLFVLLVAVLVVEFGLLVYVLLSYLKRRSSDPAGAAREPRSAWQRLVAGLLPFVLIAVFVAVVARREGDDQSTPLTLLPPVTLLPIDGTPGAGTPVVVHWWILGGLALLGAAALLCAVLVRWRRRRKEAEPRASDREELLVAVDASLKELEDDPDPRRAVINAYASMERVLSERGLPRRPSETPLEYLARWAGVLRVGRAAAEALAVLYERARFSVNLIDEEMRQEAGAALGALRRDLGEEPA